MTTAGSVAVRAPGRLVRSIILVGLLIGVITGLDDVVYFTAVEHRDPTFIFRYIASALVGQAAFTGGYAPALLGFLLHFGIAFVVAAVFILASTRLAFLRRAAIPFGLLYGLGVFLVMNILIVPHTLVPKLAVTMPLALNTLVGSILCVGLPCGLAVWWMARGK